MQKTIFTKSLRILITSLLLLAVFFQKERSQLLMESYKPSEKPGREKQEYKYSAAHTTGL